MQTTKSLKGQSILDIAVSATGTVESAYDIAETNGVSIVDTPDNMLTIPIGDVVKVAVDAIAYSPSQPATAITIQDKNESPYNGIGYMTIGYDFEME